MSSNVPDRTYEDGRHEWHTDVGDGWIKYSDDHGNSGYRRDLGNGWFKDGERYGRDHGNYIEWSDGTWERKWDK